MKKSLISLFSGAGGLDIGLEAAGFTTLFANEIEPHACASLRENARLSGLDHGERFKWFDDVVLSQRCHRSLTGHQASLWKTNLFSDERGRSDHLKDAIISECDIRKLIGNEILDACGKRRGEVDLIAGGPPCQPFSRAGKREMVECDDGQLFLEFVRLVDEIRPRWFLFENVKGLVIHKADVCRLHCKTCNTVSAPPFQRRDELKDVEQAPAHCKSCKESQDHAVHWKREKAGSLSVIISEFERLGYYCTSDILNAADFGAPQSRERLIIVGSRDGEKFTFPNRTHRKAAELQKGNLQLFSDDKLKPWTSVYDALYRQGHWRYGKLDLDAAVLWVKNVVRPHDEPVTWHLDRIAPTVGAHQSAKLAIAPFGVPPEQLFRQQWHTLGRRQGDTPPVFVEHEYLTDSELLRLQTFPTYWYLHGTRMQRAFQIGNAVPPVLAKSLGEALIAASEEKMKVAADEA